MTTLKTRWGVGLAILASGLAMAGAVTGMMTTTEAMGQAKDEVAQIGDPAPDFTLVDLEGTEHTLSQYTAEGSIVVLEWFNPTCPFVRKHYREDTKTMVKMQAEFADQGVVWLRINSGHEGHVTAGLELNTKTADAWGITTPILRDLEGTAGRAYGAKRTPAMYVIDASGVLVYRGAIDNRVDSIAPGDVNFVHAALKSTLAGEPVAKTSTKAYGCSVKYN